MHTVEQVASKLNVSLSLVYRLVRTGELESYQIASAIRVSDEQLEKYLSSTKNKPHKRLPKRHRHF